MGGGRLARLSIQAADTKASNRSPIAAGLFLSWPVTCSQGQPVLSYTPPSSRCIYATTDRQPETGYWPLETGYWQLETDLLSADHTIFTSVRTPMGCGYRLIAASPGVTAEERTKITRWSPSHGNLCSDNPAAEGLASYLLSTGRRCVAWSRHAGPEPTGRGGLRIHTHAVLLTAEAYRQFACMPAAVLQAIAALAPQPLIPQGASLAPLTIDPGPLALVRGRSARSTACTQPPPAPCRPSRGDHHAAPARRAAHGHPRGPARLCPRAAHGVGRAGYSPGRPTILTWVSAPLSPTESAGLSMPCIELEAPSASEGMGRGRRPLAQDGRDARAPAPLPRTHGPLVVRRPARRDPRPHSRTRL